jgi:hypothetical protein
LKQSHSIRMKRKTIAIINRNHVLIRLSPSPRRMEFSEATAAIFTVGESIETIALYVLEALVAMHESLAGTKQEDIAAQQVVRY